MTPEECEYILSYVNMHAPLETDNLDNDVHLLRTRCSLIPPSDGQELKEWHIKVKLMEKDFRIASGILPSPMYSGSGASSSCDKSDTNPHVKVKPMCSGATTKQLSWLSSILKRHMVLHSGNLPTSTTVVVGGRRGEDSRLTEQRRKSMSMQSYVQGTHSYHDMESALHTSRSD